MAGGGPERSEEAHQNKSQSVQPEGRWKPDGERSGESGESGRPATTGTADTERTGITAGEEAAEGLQAETGRGERDERGDGGGGRGGDQKTSKQKINIFYTNIQSLPGKVSELEVILKDEKPDIVLLSETWCNTNVTNAFLNIAGYNFQTELRNDRCDTANGVGGGLAVYTTNGLTILSCDKASDFNQYCKFKLVNGCDVVYFYLIYRPPSSGQDSKDKICELFRSAEKNSVFIGDFNLPDIDWQTGAAGSRSSDAIVEAATAAGLRQLVEFPTHTRGNVLDLVTTNVPERVENVREGERVGRSDHVVVQCELTMDRNSNNRIKVKNWSKAEWKSIRDGIKNTVWPTTTDGTTAEEAWQQLQHMSPKENFEKGAQTG
jgi:hypothetical protein